MVTALEGKERFGNGVKDGEDDRLLAECSVGRSRGEFMRMVRFRVMAVVLALVTCAGRAQTLAPGMAKQVDKVFAKWDRADSPGCALGVYRGGQVVYKRGYGMEDLNEDVHITPGTVFHVASMSKQFTAASIVLLAQQGKLSLDDEVRKYIPELPN